MNKFLLSIIIVVLLPSVLSYNDCYFSGYDYCVENLYNATEPFAYVALAYSVYDARGISYDYFIYSSDAVGPIYAKILFSGTSLYYLGNATSFNNICDGYGCLGTLMDGSGIYILANIGDAYVDCPLFISYNGTDIYDGLYSWSWVAYGYLKPVNSSCVHIRVNECLSDSDCEDGYFCNLSVSNWRDRSCLPEYDGYIGSNDTLVLGSKASPDYYGSGSYAASKNDTYVKSDLIIVALDAVGVTLASFVSVLGLLMIGLFAFVAIYVLGWLKNA